ncbi:protein bicaudal C isoform X2 [Cydia pomonella]|uniref:protein bicaudal C isoform X2 n=1 Tax=Cydia pomonella TaxID=82600 RepID=UPI002ADE6468|nr:protein bicaudal C isoform X2 [Cydia pomonella]
MASGNFLTVKTHLSEFKNNSDKDTISEASESGTSNSTSAEDLQKLAVILGLNSVEDVYQERFRVDRRRLETMLADNLDESQTAQAFFHRIMNDTNTLINWPTRLKIGARSKKDPHVRVAGRVDDVKLAREKIMQLLDTRSNRVTMKIDVSYTDHSHIIGKGGLTIKRVMEETGCHIHFPDSNRTSAIEKSNQVSIAGDMERVERARARVRALTPLVFCFELPIVAPSQPLPDINSPYVQQIQEQYNVQVMLRNRPKLHANLLVVKGVQWEVQATMEATGLLMNYMCGQLASQTHVQMSLEISPIHHSVVVGRGAEQLKVIMKGTNTQIMFPDADDPNIPVIKKSCVTITGQIKDVYTARQQLVGSLPLVVIFDVPEEACRLDPDAAVRLMHKYNVYINIRRKPKQGIASVVIKGIERCAGDLYEARRELLGGKEPVITAEIPESYSIPALPSMPFIYTSFSPSHPTVANSPCSPYNMPLSEMPNYASPMFQTPTPGGYPSPLSPVAITPPVFPSTWLIPSPQPRAGQFHYPSMVNMYKNNAWNPMSNSPDMGSMQPPMMLQPTYQQMPEARHTTLNQLLNSSSQASSGYQSNFTGSSVSLDTQNISGGDGSNIASPSVSPISKGHSPAPSAETDRSIQGMLSGGDGSNIASPSVSPISKGHSPAPSAETDRSIQGMLSGGDGSNIASPSVSPISKGHSPAPSAETDRSIQGMLSGGDGSNIASPSVSPISKGHSPAPSAETDRSIQGMLSGGDGSNIASPSVSPISKGHSPAPSAETDRSIHGMLSGGDGSNIASPSVSPISKGHSPAPSAETDRSIQGMLSGGDGSNIASPSVSPISKGHSPAPSAETDRSIQEIASIISDLPLSERRAPGCEKKTLETLGKLSPLTEYRKMKAEATKAMQEKVGSNYRMPTPRWSGYYFSHTSPGPINMKEEMATTPEKGWNRSELVRPNIMEKPSPPQAAQATGKPCRYQQLYELLREIGLHKYIDLFKKHELDMSTFASLNEADLTEIGVTAFGARRKMLLIIAELQKQASAFKGSAAPGAERKLLGSPPYNTGAIAQDKW